MMTLVAKCVVHEYTIRKILKQCTHVPYICLHAIQEATAFATAHTGDHSVQNALTDEVLDHVGLAVAPFGVEADSDGRVERRLAQHVGDAAAVELVATHQVRVGRIPCSTQAGHTLTLCAHT